MIVIPMNAMRPKLVIQVMELSNEKARPRAVKAPVAHGSSRDIVRGIWELARLHTREAWLCWYPAGTHPHYVGGVGVGVVVAPSGWSISRPRKLTLSLT
jgi:hypothetical protein